ncbi:multiple epidermal growth factor-like domains protein 10 isoform X2 [Haliotis cracherodii]
MLTYLAVVCLLFAPVQGECLPGFTGYKCATRCAQGCRNGSCTVQRHGGIACDDGCKDGFSGESCRTRCSGQCKRCERYQSETCLQCNSGYYGDFCQHNCESCGAAGCDKDGMCYERPHNCDGGVICGKTCIQNCRLCTHTGTCSHCRQNYAGDSCQKPCKNCLGTCTSAGCLDGCRCGYTGPFCQKQCSSKCSETCSNNGSLSRDMCDSVDETCLEGCKNGHFGERCQHGCNKNCKLNICVQESGKCRHGCNSGYYGESCEHACDNCQKDRCSRKGRCYECKNGYFGSDCDLKCESICSFSCERYTGVCVAKNTTVDVTKQTSGATRVGQLSVVSSSTQNISEINLAEAKSKLTAGSRGIVFWSCIAAGLAVTTVLTLTCIGLCRHRSKKRRLQRKMETIPQAPKISQEDLAPEVPSSGRPYACQNDYDEIPDLSYEIPVLTRVNMDEHQTAVRGGDARPAGDGKMPRKVYLKDNTRKCRSKDVHVNKYLSVVDTASTDGYLDIIG